LIRDLFCILLRQIPLIRNFEFNGRFCQTAVLEMHDEKLLRLLTVRYMMTVLLTPKALLMATRCCLTDTPMVMGILVAHSARRYCG